MKVLDANFLIDYLSGEEATEAFYSKHGGADEHWVMPAPAFAEAVVGVGNLPDGNVDEAIEKLSWGQVYEIDTDLTFMAAEIADEIGPEGPFLNGMDALIAAVGRDLDAPVVSIDRDLTHPETKKVVDVEEY